MKNCVPSLSRILKCVICCGLSLHANLGWTQSPILRSQALPALHLANGDSVHPSLDASGRWVVYSSSAANLVANDTNGHGLDVFIFDRIQGTTRLVSESRDGQGSGDDDSMGGVISSDGRWVAFESKARNLVTNAVTGAGDVYVRDLLTSRTLLVSRSSAGEGGHALSSNPIFSRDSRYLVFESAADNLTANDENQATDLFRYELETETLTLVSPDVTGQATPRLRAEDAFGGCSGAALSGDGSWIVFAATTTNLVSGVPNNLDHYYVRDMATAVTTTLDLNQQAKPALYTYSGTSMSEDGRFVLFHSLNQTSQRLQLRDLRSDLMIINPAAAPNPTNSAMPGSILSPDGRWVAYQGARVSTNRNQLVLYDQTTGVGTVVSTNAAGGEGDGKSEMPFFTPDSRKLVYGTVSTNVVPAWKGSGAPYRWLQRDLASGETRQLFPQPGWQASRDGGPTIPAVSAEGSWVALSVGDLGEALGDVNGCSDVILFSADGQSPPVLVSRPIVEVAGSGATGYVELRPNCVSADGRWVAFASAAADLVSEDGNGEIDTFLLDRNTGQTTLISHAYDSRHSAQGSTWPFGMSADGQRVVLLSTATNLADPTLWSDTNRVADVFVWDRTTDRTRLVSENAQHTRTGSKAASWPSISSDGRFVAYQSSATDVVKGGTGATTVQVYRFAMDDGTNALVSALTTGTPGTTFATGFPVISQNGAQVLFWSAEAGMAADSPSTRYTHLRLRDVAAGKTTTLTTNIPFSDQGSGNIAPEYPMAFSTNGDWISFFCLLSSTSRALYAHSRTNASNYRLSTTATSQAMTPNGHYVVYAATNLSGVAPSQIYVVATANRTSDLISSNASLHEAANGDCSHPAISPDGRYVIFQSKASNLTPTSPARTNSLFLFDRTSRTMVNLGDGVLPTGPVTFLSQPFLLWSGRALLFTASWAGQAGSLPQQIPQLIELQLPLEGDAPILMIERRPGVGFTVSWPALPGATDRLQFTQDPDLGPWTDVGAEVQVIEGRASATDAQALNDGYRFYRVVRR